MTSRAVLVAAPVRDGLVTAAHEAARWRASTDFERAVAVGALGVLLEHSCCDANALEVFAAAPEALRGEVLGAIEGNGLIAAIGAAGGDQ